MKSRVDWSAVLFDIYRHYRNWAEIMRKLDSSHGALTGWRDRKQEMSYSKGEKVVDLWMAVTGKTVSELPRLSDG